MVVLVAGAHVEHHEPHHFKHFAYVFGEQQRQAQQAFIGERGFAVRCVQQAAGGVHMHLLAMHPVKALDAEISRRGCRRKQVRFRHIQPGFSGRQGICIFRQPGVWRFVRGAKFDDPGGSLGFPRPLRHNAVIIGNVHQNFGSGPCG